MIEPLDVLVASHTPEAIRKRLADGPTHSYLKDFVYGAIDGTVTTFAVVSGVAGADLSSGVVVVLGLANLIGDGFSMAVSNFQSSRAEEQRRERLRRLEESHVRNYPDGEREEIRQIFVAKGFVGENLDKAVEVITSDVAQWVNMMMQDEHGVSLTGASPWRAAVATFAAFVSVGVLPLLAFLAYFAVPSWIPNPYVWSLVVTAFTFFAVGAVKGKFVEHRWYMAGLETLICGSAAAGLAYLVGWLLKSVVSV